MGVIFVSNRAIHPQESGDNILSYAKRRVLGNASVKIYEAAEQMVMSGGSGDGDGGGGESLSFINTAAVVVTPSLAVNHVGRELWVSTWADSTK